jgi:predicted CXXCH cytochrome family protein
MTWIKRVSRPKRWKKACPPSNYPLKLKSDMKDFVLLKKKTKFLNWTFVLICATLLLTLGFVTNARANGGPHGGYTATTDACAGCHRAHTGQAAGLLVSAQPGLCYTCHGSSATGSVLNVADGAYEGAGGGNLLAGGFSSYGGQPATSSHRADGTWRTMWGSGGASGECDYCHAAANIPIDPSIPNTVEFQQNLDSLGNLTNMNSLVQLNCSSCHDVHGNGNYRILRYAEYCAQPAGPWDSHSSAFGVNVPCAVTVTSNEGGTNNYTTPQYLSGLTDWCSTCHSNYRNQTDIKDFWGMSFPMEFDSLDGNGNVFRYRHSANAQLGAKTTVLPLNDLTDNGNSADDELNCITCHFAHGTNVLMTSALTNAVAPTNDSALLRIQDRGVCENCHQK